MHYPNFQSFPSPFSIRKLHLKYTREILKNTKEKSGDRIFHFLALCGVKHFGVNLFEGAKTEQSVFTMGKRGQPLAYAKYLITFVLNSLNE